MLMPILTRTPTWVWLLLAALLLLGFTQTRPRSVTLWRALLLPVIMTALSLFGTVSAFGAKPLVVMAWMVAGAAIFSIVLAQGKPSHDRYDPMSRRFSIAGSWMPMLLILGIFIVKFAVGASTAVNPLLIHELSFTLGLSAIYGAFSGAFLGRGYRLLRLANPV
jgi:hypothetical protein